MTTQYHGNDLRSIGYGVAISKDSGTLSSATSALFTVAGGLVAITSMVARVNIAITNAGNYKIQHNPAAGTTKDLTANVDLGSTDTAAGEILVVTGLATDTLTIGAKSVKQFPIIMDSGDIEQVSTCTDGAMFWYLTWVPLSDGATVVAA